MDLLPPWPHFSIRSFGEFRAEAFNVFNHTQWEPNFAFGIYSALDANFGSGTFLTPLMAHRARTMQFGLKLFF